MVRNSTIEPRITLFGSVLWTFECVKIEQVPLIPLCCLPENNNIQRSLLSANIISLHPVNEFQWQQEKTAWGTPFALLAAMPFFKPMSDLIFHVLHHCTSQALSSLVGIDLRLGTCEGCCWSILFWLPVLSVPLACEFAVLPVHLDNYMTIWLSANSHSWSSDYCTNYINDKFVGSLGHTKSSSPLAAVHFSLTYFLACAGMLSSSPNLFLHLPATLHLHLVAVLSLGLVAGLVLSWLPTGTSQWVSQKLAWSCWEFVGTVPSIC